MIKVDNTDMHIEGTGIELLSEYGLLTTKLLEMEKLPRKYVCETIKLAFELLDVNIMEIITCDLELTDQLKQEIENFKKEFEKGE